jgi:DNA uptake protein ComE-like DNA-binding protein
MGEETSKEARILRVMKHVLTSVAKDTATEPGVRHPLSEQTIQDIRMCLLLISEREAELAVATGREMNERPHFKDEPKPQGDVVIPLGKIGRANKAD